MSYSNYLVKINGGSGAYEINMKKYIKADSYSVTYSGQDVDSYRDANGLLHRNALAHTCVKVEFETPPMLTNDDVATLFSNIRSRYTNATEKKLSITAYVPELDDYKTIDVYVPDVTFSIYGTYNDKIHYNAIRIAFIEY